MHHLGARVVIEEGGMLLSRQRWVARPTLLMHRGNTTPYRTGAVATMNCPECGTEVADDRPYCPSCAANLTEDTAADSGDSAGPGPGDIDLTSPADLAAVLVGMTGGIGLAAVILVGGLVVTLLLLSPVLWYMGLTAYCVDMSNDPPLFRAFARLLVVFYDLFDGLYGSGSCQRGFLVFVPP